MTSRLQPRTNTPTAHAGFSLVELLAVMTMSVAILGLATTLLHRMFVHQQVAKADTRFQLRTTRLASHFRTDAAAANSCETIDGAGLKLLHSDGTLVTYRVDADKPMVVHREQTFAETDKKHIDQFAFPASCSIALRRVEPDGKATGSLAQMRIRLPDPTLESNATRKEAGILVDDDDPDELVIEAAVGTRSRRLKSLQEASPTDE